MRTIREFEPADRYTYDFGVCSYKNGFAQVDTSQDASYYGTWADPFRLVIVNYCEGDVTTQFADNADEFAAELRAIKAWNEQNGMRFLGIDPFTPEIEARFVSMGLADLFHQSKAA